MSALPLVHTEAANGLDALLLAMLHELQSIDLDEAHTDWRLTVRNRIARVKAARYLVSDVELEAGSVLAPGMDRATVRDTLARYAEGRRLELSDAA